MGSRKEEARASSIGSCLAEVPGRRERGCKLSGELHWKPGPNTKFVWRKELPAPGASLGAGGSGCRLHSPFVHCFLPLPPLTARTTVCFPDSLCFATFLSFSLWVLLL